MTCEPFKFTTADGKTVSGFVCSRGTRAKKCVACGGRAGRLCDWKLRGRAEGRTCSRPVCERCSVQPADGKDLCPAHAEQWKKHPKNPTTNEER